MTAVEHERRRPTEEGPAIDDGGRTLVATARGVLDHALEAYAAERPDADVEWARAVLADARARLDEPLRVALAGTLTSGKSTLLNALVGERVAATDAGECTRVVTWYAHADEPSLTVEDADGTCTSVTVTRGDPAAGDGGPVVDPDELSAALAAAGEDARLLVGWPSDGLADVTLVDTPGLDSLRAENSRRTLTLVTPDDRPSGVDVVVYLVRHAHATDVRFLEAFADLASGGAGGLGSVGAAGTVLVLSRADEVGGGGLDALRVAGRAAAAYAADPMLRPLCQTVVAVDGLLAETARTLTEDEFRALRALSGAPVEGLTAMLLTVDRFTVDTLPAGVGEAVRREDGRPGVKLDAPTRRRLLERLGLHGVRVALAALLGGAADRAALAAELRHASGLDDLAAVLRTRVRERAGVHQARSALLAVDLVLSRVSRPAAAPVVVELEQVLAGAHEFTEQRLCAALRTGAIDVPAELGREAERLLGGDGPGPFRRLGLEITGDWRPAARATLRRWRTRSESPLTSRALAEVARAVVRSVEGLLAAADGTPGSRRARVGAHV